MRSVVVVGGPACGKTAVWLGLALALGAGALRLERPALTGAAERDRDGQIAGPVARGRFGAARGRHGVRVAHVVVSPAGGGGAWPLALRVVDGPGIEEAGAAPAGELARLIREALAADLQLHVLSEPAGAVDAALDELARVRRIPREVVFVERAGARAPSGSRRLRLSPAGRLVASDARALADRVRERFVPVGGRSAGGRAQVLP